MAEEERGHCNVNCSDASRSSIYMHDVQIQAFLLGLVYTSSVIAKAASYHYYDGMQPLCMHVISIFSRLSLNPNNSMALVRDLAGRL